jgi:SecD/SecF fusion protein
MNITKYEKYFFILPGVFSLLAIIALGMWGLKPGIDLAGGSLLQVSYAQGRPAIEPSPYGSRQARVGRGACATNRRAGIYLASARPQQREKNTLETALGTLGAVHEDQYNSVGPIIGSELVQKAWIAILVVASIIALYCFCLSWRF